MQHALKNSSAKPAATQVRPAPQAPPVPAPAVQRQQQVGREILRFTARPASVQRQVAAPVLRAAQLHAQEVGQLTGQQQTVQRQMGTLASNLPEGAVEAALQRQAQLATFTPPVTQPVTPSDWVTVMRQRAEQVEGQRLDPRRYGEFTALQRQVAGQLGTAFRQDRGPTAERHEAFAGHLVTLQRHVLSRPVAQVVLGGLPAGERPAIQRAVAELQAREAVQRQQDEQALHLHALQRQLAELDDQATQPVLARIQAKRGSGNPLPAAVRRHLEQGLNHDLSRVRIHDDAEADKLAKGVNAVAFTTGTDIFFRSGKFNPNTQSGLELLAHEVTHTVQQSQGRVGKGIDPDAALETEARSMGSKLARVMPSAKSLMPPNPHAPGMYTKAAALRRAQHGAVNTALHRPFQALGLQRQAAGLTIQRNFVLDKVADLAGNIPGYRELCLAFGKDLVTGKTLTSNPNAILDALANLVPGPFKDMLKVVRQQNLIPKAWAWFKGELGKLELGKALSEVKGAIGKFPPDLGAARAALTRRADGLKRLIAGSARHIAQIALTAIEAGLGPVGKKVMNTLKKGGDVLVKVMRDPARFAKNLLNALSQGFTRFRTNAGRWMKEGLGQWLSGTSGIQFPATLDVRGVFMTALSLMGLTYHALRGRLVKELGQGGETKVAAAEKAGGALASLTKGLHAAPELKGQQASVGKDVVEGLKTEVTRSLVTAGAAKVASMLVPGGAFVQALLTAFQGIQTVISQSSQIMGVIVNALGSVQAIAAGQVGAAAAFVERTIGGSIPIVLTFLGKVARVGNIGTRIKDTVKRLRARLDKSIDGLIARVKKTLGGKPEATGNQPTTRNGNQTPPRDDVRSKAEMQRDVDRAVAQAVKLSEEANATPESVRKAFPGLIEQHRIKTLELKPERRGRYRIVGTVNPSSKKAGLLLKGMVYAGKLSVEGSAGTQRVVAQKQGWMEQILTSFRQQQLGVAGQVSYKDILKKCNYALGHIVVAGYTAKGTLVRRHLNVTRDNALTIFSSGQGLVSREQVKLPIVDAQGREIRSGGSTASPHHDLLPKIALDVTPKIVVADAEELRRFINEDLAPAINAKGYTDSLHKHSEQVLWQMMRFRQAEIAAVISSLGIVRITEFRVDIHSEREMCGMCSATSNFMMANLKSHLPAIHELLAKSNRDTRRTVSTQTLVSATHPFPSRAPAATPNTPGVTTRAYTLDSKNPAPPAARSFSDFDH